MAGRVTLIGLEDRAGWEAATACCLPGQSWDFASGLAEMGPAPQLAHVTDGAEEMLLPFLRRDFRGSTDIATLPGLSGALLRPGGAGPLRVWADFARAQGWVAGYIQLAAANSQMPVPPPDRRAVRNALYVYDLPGWDFQTAVTHKMRNALRRAGRAGRTDRDGAALVQDQARLAPAFLALHAGTLDRLGSAPAFPPAVLAAWIASPLVRLFGAEVDGVLQSVLLCLCKGAEAEALLLASTPEGRSLQGWMVWQTAEVLSREGFTAFNIGGYGVAGDGLHRMKARLGAREVPMVSVRQVYDPATFAALCADTGADPDGDYFPPYRAAPGSARADDLGGGADQARGSERDDFGL